MSSVYELTLAISTQHLFKDFFFFSLGGVRLIPLGKSTVWHITPARMMDDDECGDVGEMIGKGNRSVRRKPAPVPLYPPQSPHDLSRARIFAATVRSLSYHTAS
jgi:hypothetical protein